MKQEMILTKIMRSVVIGVCAMVFCWTALPAHAVSYTGVDLRIETPGQTVLQQTVYVSDAGCAVTDSTGVEHELTGDNALCAVDSALSQAGLEYVLTYYDGFGFFLSSIGDDVSDFTNYWLYYINYQSPAVGLSDYDMEEGDELLLTYGGFNPPLRLTLSRTHRRIDAVVTAVVEYYYSDWMTGEGYYVPAVGAIVYYGDQEYIADHNGRVAFMPSITGDYQVYAEADGYVRTASQELKVYRQQQSFQAVGKDRRQELIQEGVAYLKSETDDSGLVSGSHSVTEWSAMAIAAAKKNSKKIFAAVEDYRPTSEDGASEIARHILALEAIGKDARGFEGVDYTKRLKKTMVSEQFGNEAYCNDDIFAILALIAASEAYGSDALQQGLEATLSCVNDDGGVSFAVEGDSDIDTTAAWLQMAGRLKGKKKQHGISLKPYRKKAVKFLRRNQNPDGGWGYTPGSISNSSTTAWVLLALRARGHEAKAMTTNNQNGFHFLSSIQRSADGAIQYDSTATSSLETMNTAYSIMALAKRPMPVNKPAKLNKKKR